MKLRSFVAIELPDDVKDTLAGVRSSLENKLRGARWVRPSGMHLTLKFLGDVPAEEIPDISSSVQQAVAGAEPFSLRTAGLGVFPKKAKARVLWTGLDGDVDACRDVQARVENAIKPLGFKPEKRRFTPHLTNARFRNPCTIPEEVLELSTEPVSFMTSRIVLFQSTLNPKGAVYTPLATMPFDK